MKLFTTKEVAERLSLRPKTVESYFRTGRIKALKIGRRWRVSQSELDTFVKERLAATQQTLLEHEGWETLTHTKLAEVWNHPDEVDYPL